MSFKVVSAIGDFVWWQMADLFHVNSFAIEWKLLLPLHFFVQCQSRRIPWISTNYWEFSHHAQGQDPQEWDTKLTSIKALVQSTLDHFRTLCPQDSQQAILEELEKLKAENAALKASQAPGSGGQPSQNTQSPTTGQPQINAFFPPSGTPGGPSSPADPMMPYRRKDAEVLYAIQAPQTGTEAKARDWVKKNVPKERQGELNKNIETLQNHLKQFDQANQPNLEPILSDWGLFSSFLTKCNVDAHIRLLAAVQLLRN